MFLGIKKIFEWHLPPPAPRNHQVTTVPSHLSSCAVKMSVRTVIVPDVSEIRALLDLRITHNYDNGAVGKPRC